VSTLLLSNTQFKGTFEPQTSVREAAHVGTSYSQIPNLQSQVTVLTNSISDEALRIAVGKVLTDLVFLLDYLSLVAGGPREPGGIKEAIAILNAVRGEAYSLVFFIENHAMRLEGLDDRLNETLDSSAYAIQHELRRIFESELTHVGTDHAEKDSLGVLLHAQGVLTNCFQQCMINLVRVFDETVTGARLFQDWQHRRERSLVLCRDLSELLELVQVSEKESLGYASGQDSMARLVEQLTTFREGSMRCLMYKDWHEYETLSEQIIAAIKNGENPANPLHHMACYLETLLAHVKARSVLADLALEPFCLYEKVDAA
jgi:hypothetical protein